MKIGIVGTGRISKLFLTTINLLPEIQCTAICTREKSMERAKKLVMEYRIQDNYNNYLEFLTHGNFEWVYIGIENGLHFQYGKAALEYQKHLIIEKPLAGRLHQVKELYEKAVFNRKFLFESMSLFYMPLYFKMKKQIKMLKDVKIVICNFSKVSKEYNDYINGNIWHSFDVGNFGGALYDLNIYNINFVTSIWGMPLSSKYYPNQGYNGIDTSGVLLLTYLGFQVCCISAKDSDAINFIQVQGSNGYVYMEGTANAFPKIISNIDGECQVFKEERDYQERMSYELEAILRIYKQRDFQICYKIFENTLNTFEIIEKIVKGGEKLYEESR